MTAGLDADEAREELYAVMRADDSFESKAEAALEIGERYLDVDNGHVARIDEASEHWQAIASTDDSGGTYPPGEVLSLGETYCRRTVQSEDSIALHEAGAQGWGDDPAYQAQGLECYHGTTITVNGSPYGTVCFVAADARDRPFGDAETMFAELVARLLEHELERKRTADRVERLESFASVVSHDLRNPLNVATGRIETERARADSEHLRAASESLDRMDDIVADVLAIARQGRDVTETQAVSLSTIAHDCWQQVDTDDARLVVHDDLQFQADRSSLRHLFENLVRNSIEHGTPDTRTRSGDSTEHGATGNRPQSGDRAEQGGVDVTVFVGALEEASGFYVADDGSGIPASERANVFDSGYSTGEAGIGLGLSIVESVVSAHDWTIDVVESESGGARFEFADVPVTRQP